ncbi:MAG: RNA 2',3'-cyclic phosphodiesterase [Bacteroidales bacterium]|nr:RNA 2',3'-cyclic phosphodiesterase [Bacteroidales bacterium]
MKRLFVAIKIELSKELLDFISNLKNKSSEFAIVKWVETNNIHITLKFLGNTDEGKIPEIENAFKSISLNHKSFYLEIEKFGAFRSFSKPEILWLGIKNNLQITLLAEEIDNSLNALGFDKENRKFKAHITIGRVKKINDRNLFCALLLEQEQNLLQKIKINEFHLFESILKPDGPVYNVLRSFELKK